MMFYSSFQTLSSIFSTFSGVTVHISYPTPDAGSLPEDPIIHLFARAVASFSDRSFLYSVSNIAFMCTIFYLVTTRFDRTSEFGRSDVER